MVHSTCIYLVSAHSRGGAIILCFHFQTSASNAQLVTNILSRGTNGCGHTNLPNSKQNWSWAETPHLFVHHFLPPPKGGAERHADERKILQFEHAAAAWPVVTGRAGGRTCCPVHPPARSVSVLSPERREKTAAILRLAQDSS